MVNRSGAGYTSRVISHEPNAMLMSFHQKPLQKYCAHLIIFSCSSLLLINGSAPLLVAVAFSSRARILGECSTIHFLPAVVVVFFKWRLARTHKFHSLGQD